MHVASTSLGVSPAAKFLSKERGEAIEQASPNVPVPRHHFIFRESGACDQT